MRPCPILAKMVITHLSVAGDCLTGGLQINRKHQIRYLPKTARDLKTSFSISPPSTTGCWVLVFLALLVNANGIYTHHIHLCTSEH
jgi:hypothetical protein